MTAEEILKRHFGTENYIKTLKAFPMDIKAALAAMEEYAVTNIAEKCDKEQLQPLPVGEDEPKWIDLTLSQLVKQSLELGKVPVFEFMSKEDTAYISALQAENKRLREQLKAAQFVRWVKASERQPEESKYLPLKINGEYDFGFYMDVAGDKLFEASDMEQYEIEYVEWLEEAPAQAAQPPVLPSIPEEVLQELGEKEVMIKAFADIRKAFETRSWIMEGRGCYPYNDYRYKKEVRYLYDEVDAIAKEVWSKIKTKTFEYREKIIADYKAKQQAAQPPAAEAVAGQIKPFKPIKGKLYVHYPSFTEDNSKLIDAECIGIVGEIGHFQCYDIHGEKWENIQTANIRLFTTTKPEGGNQ